MKYQESKYVGFDGLSMHMSQWIPDDEKPRALLIAIHGLGGHAEEMQNIGEYFSERGIAVFAPDMRGFGHYSGLKGHVMSFDEYIEDMYNIVMQVKDKFINKITFLLGFSIGGQHVVRYVATYPKDIDGIILACPGVSQTLKIGLAKSIALRILSGLNVKRLFANELKYDLASHDPKVVEDCKKDPLRFDMVTPRFAAENLKCTKIAMKAAPEISLPALVLQAGDDIMVDPEKTREFFDMLGSKDKTWRFYEGFYHDIIREGKKDLVLKDIENWLEVRLPT